MKMCSICHRISGTGEDHLDCVQKHKIEMEDEGFKQKIPDRLNSSKSTQLATEIKAILEHMSREGRQ